jgi:hypothetical protein
MFHFEIMLFCSFFVFFLSYVSPLSFHFLFLCSLLLLFVVTVFLVLMCKYSTTIHFMLKVHPDTKLLFLKEKAVVVDFLYCAHYNDCSLSSVKLHIIFFYTECTM